MRNNFIRTVLIVVLVLSLLLTSVVFFRNISQALSETKSSYNIKVVYSSDYDNQKDSVINGIIIGFDEDSTDEGSKTPDIVLGPVEEDGNRYIYILGQKTDIIAESENVSVVKGTIDGESFWFIDGKNTLIPASDNLDDYEVTIEKSKDDTYIVGGVVTDIPYTEDNPTVKVSETKSYILEMSDGTEVSTEVSLKEFGRKFKEGLGYGAPIHMIGDSLLSSDQNLLDKFAELTEILETSKDYYLGGGSKNGDEHFANKYYLQNTNEQDVYLRMHIKVTNSVNNAVDAARFMFAYKNSETGKYVYEVYAKAKSDGTQEYVAAEYNNKVPYEPEKFLIDINNITYPFTGQGLTTENTRDAWLAINLKESSEGNYLEYITDAFVLKAGDTISYTFSVWFEASDLDHNDSIKDGSITFSIDYELVNNK